MEKKWTFLLLALLMPLTALVREPEGGNQVTLSGYVRDQHNGEELIGANIYLKGQAVGTSSNAYGFYSLTLEPGRYTIVYSYMGYHPGEKEILLKEDRTLNMELSARQQQLEKVVIRAEKANENISRSQMSFEKLSIKKIRKMPSFMGEVDIIKSIQLMPGVHNLSEGSAGYSVRGGSQDQNLVILDEATVYNISHFMGFFSVFNNDAIQNVELYKGDIPARYGTRLSSVLDVRMKNGNSKRFRATGGIGNISSRLTLEGPIANDRTSFIVSGRRTYFDLFLPLLPEESVQNTSIYFYDLNAKINHRINKNNRLYLSGYFGQDRFNNDFSDIGYGNRTMTLRWNHLFSEKLFFNLTLLHSKYNYHLGSPEEAAWSYRWDSHLMDNALKADFTWYINTSNTLRFGGSSYYHTYDPGLIRGTGEESLYSRFELSNRYALEHGMYLSNQQQLAGGLSLKYGVRLSAFQNMGRDTVFEYNSQYEVVDSTAHPAGEIYNTYMGLEPRLGIKYQLNNRHAIKASYSRTRQYVQLAQNTRAGTPLDLWFPASPNVKPQISDQYALGYFRNFFGDKLEVSVEGYYKRMQHTIDFKDHANLLLNPRLEGELRFGTSRSHGVELMTRFDTRKINGWVSYTWSRTTRDIEAINDGKIYRAPYDRPHDLSVVANYHLNDRISLSANWVYSSGQPVTLPIGRFESEGKIVPVYSGRNQYRLPDYHRLDLSLTIQGREKPDKKWQGEWNLSVYNAYGQKNTWALNFIQDETDPYKTTAQKTYLFSVIPSLTYNFKF
jgi:hypothetical protein